MRTRYIPIIIMLVAGLAACIVTYMSRYSVLDSLLVIFVVLIIFYTFGYIIKKIVERFLIVGAKAELSKILAINEESGEPNDK